MNLLLSAACEFAKDRPDGRLDLVGIFDELQAPGFPAVQDRMTVVFVMEWTAEEQGRRDFRADLVNQNDGKAVLTIEGHTEVAPPRPGGRARTRLVMAVQDVVFPESGEYRFVLKAADQSIPALSLHLSEADPDAS